MSSTGPSNIILSSNSVRSPNRRQPSAPESPIPKFFLTSMSDRELYGEGYGLVLQLHKQLSNMVDGIGSKVTEAIDRSESEFLIAYRNHMKKIRNQLEEMRVKLQIHQNETSVEKVSILQKQLRLFREESLKMYDKLELKNRECEELTARLKELRQENGFLQEEVKKLMKVNKIIEMEKNNVSKSLVQYNKSVDHSQTIFRPSQDNFFANSRASHRPISQNRVNSGKYQSKIKEITKGKNVEQEVTKLVHHIVHDKNTTISRLQSKCKHNQDSSTDLRSQNQLQTFFLDCVEAVRKDLYKKKNHLSQTRWDVTNYALFKDLDKIQILYAFVSNENVMRGIFRQMFEKESVGQPGYFSRLHVRTSKRANRAASTFLN